MPKSALKRGNKVKSLDILPTAVTKRANAKEIQNYARHQKELADVRIILGFQISDG